MKSPDISTLTNSQLLERRERIDNVTELLNQIDFELVRELFINVMKRCGMTEAQIQDRFADFDIDKIRLRTKEFFRSDKNPMEFRLSYGSSTLKLKSKNIYVNIDSDYGLVFSQFFKVFLHELCHYSSTTDRKGGYMTHGSSHFSSLNEGVTDFLATIFFIKYNNVKKNLDRIDLSYIFSQNVFLVAVKLLAEITGVEEDKCVQGFIHSYFAGDSTFDEFVNIFVKESNLNPQEHEKLDQVMSLLAGFDPYDEDRKKRAIMVMYNLAKQDGKVREIFAQNNEEGKAVFDPYKVSIEYHRLANVL